MIRPLVAGLLGFVAACAAERATRPVGPEPLPSNQAEGAAALADGHYRCRLRSDGYLYGWYPCVVRTEDGQQVLEKTRGSQRVRGVILEQGDGFTFEGRFFCPYGDCDAPIEATFSPGADAGWEASFPTRYSQVTMYLSPEPMPGYGGVPPGGAGYGYGGW